MPLRDLVNKFSHIRFEPAGFTGNAEIPIAKSIVDYIFRWLGARFLPKDERDALGIIAHEVVPEAPVVNSAPWRWRARRGVAPAPLAADHSAQPRLRPCGGLPAWARRQRLTTPLSLLEAEADGGAGGSAVLV